MKKIYLMYPQKIGRIAPEIYGHFTEHIGGVIYDGIWVGKDSEIPNIKGFRKDIVEKLRAIKAPVIRWPGGCFAEVYDWRDGIGENRPTRVNWWTRFDGRYETNEVGTHEFMDFCEAVGVDAYFAANLTTVTPLQVRNWMDYCLSPQGTTTLALEREKNGHPEPFKIPYWGVGNENWYAGGNMTPSYYDSSVSVSASVKEGKTLITIANISCSEDAEILLEGVGMTIPRTAEATVLYAEDMHAHNTFEEPDAVVPQELVLDPTKPITIPKAGILAITF